MLFSEIIAQNEIKSALTKMVDEDKIHHANLLIGKMGRGTMALGLAFAQYILCENKINHDSCGTCSSCSKVQKFAHPDLHISYPTFESKELSSERIDQWREIQKDKKGYFTNTDWVNFNKAKNFKIRKEECDQIIKNFVLMSFEGNYKIQIIWMAELLGNESNSLLKLLEEPPEKSIFILIAESIDSILPTIISRCQLFKVPAIDKEQLLDALKTEFPDKLNDISRIAQISDGDLLYAREALMENNFNLEAAVFKWMKLTVTASQRKNIETIAALMKFCEGIASTSKEEQKAFIFFVLHFLRESLLLKFSNNCNLAQELKKVADYVAEKVEIDQISYLQDLLDTALMEIDRNGNSKMIFVNLSIKASKAFNRAVFLNLE